jgi:hypothetical protein
MTSAQRTLDYNYYSVDMDLGDMFLNFPLHKSLQRYSGVDVTPYKEELNISGEGVSCWHWSQTWMGWRPSPQSVCVG